jgi:hypothetical protein
MSDKSVNIKGMFREIEEINRKYGVPKTMGFVPDRLEIVLQRRENEFDLTYTEFFNYLPDNVLETAKNNVVQLLQQLGIPQKITELEKGVRVQISGDPRVALFPMMELLIQNRNIGSELEQILASLRSNAQIWLDFSDLHWDWKGETENKYKDFIATLEKIMEEHPSYASEIQAVIEKYAANPPKTSEEEAKKRDRAFNGG